MNKFFVEIGAANFDTLLPLAKNGWSGYVFEPIPHLYDDCVAKFKDYDVQVFPIAISDFNGTAKMAVARPHGDKDWRTGCSHITHKNHLGFRANIHPKRSGDFEGEIEVPCLTLDEALKGHSGNIDFMKIDTEGHENNIIQSYSFKIKPKFLKIEHKHVDDIYLSLKLTENGYLVWKEKDDIYAII